MDHSNKCPTFNRIAKLGMKFHESAENTADELKSSTSRALLLSAYSSEDNCEPPLMLSLRTVRAAHQNLF
jgi:hypothetical protein